MELKQLRYFLQVCDAGSIAGAARTLHIAQPALSRHIASLEHQLGTRLLVRLPGGVVPTRPGQELQALARDILARTLALGEQLKIASHGVTGRIRVGIMPGYSAMPQLAATVARLRQQAPELEIHVEAFRSSELLSLLKRRKIDICLAAWRSPFDASFLGTGVCEETMGIALPGHWPQARQRRALTMRDLARQPMIMFPREASPVHYDKVVDACLSAGFDPRHCRLSAADIQAMLGMVCAGLGYAIAPMSFSRQWGPDVAFCAAKDLKISFTLELVRMADDHDPLIDRFLAAWWMPAPAGA
ncbi:LysR family transcriptional regulator [Bordetella petrii]|uniref:LysR family transcriptional regulator n=1 Tax=Bordetella petrii TaxID=94624 RepID=UPI0038B22F13